MNLLIGMIGGIIEDSKVFHGLGKALDYAKGLCEDYYISEQRFNTQERAGWNSDNTFYFSNDIGGNENEYEIFIHPIKIEDAPLPALVVGEQNKVLADVHKLMEKGYHPIDLEVIVIRPGNASDIHYSILMVSRNG